MFGWPGHNGWGEPPFTADTPRPSLQINPPAVNQSEALYYPICPFHVIAYRIFIAGACDFL